MSCRSVQLQESPWYRLVRCLVLLYVAALERRIARLLAAMDALPMDSKFDAEFARLDDRCYGLECLRDHYRAWLDDPAVGLPRFRAAYDGVLPRGFAVVRRLGRLRAGVTGVAGRIVLTRAPPWGGRCTITSLRALDRPAGLAGTA